MKYFSNIFTFSNLKTALIVVTIASFVNGQTLYDSDFEFQKNPNLNVFKWVVKNPNPKFATGPYITSCGEKVFGGYEVFGKDTVLERKYSGLPLHYQIKIKLRFFKIDSWNDEDLIIYLSSGDQEKPIYQQSFNMYQDAQICGTSYCKGTAQIPQLCYNDKIVQIEQDFDHSKSDQIIKIITSLNQEYQDESFGVADYLFYLYKCHPSCATGCTGDLNSDCVACATGYFIYENKCITKADCPLGTYFLNNSCQNCDSTKCANCIDSSTNCLSCNTNKFLHNNQCYDVCPDTFYASKLTLKCEKCVSPCLNCVQDSNNSIKCLSCVLGKFKNGSECLNACPTTLLTEEYECKTECSPNYFLLEETKKCLANCPDYKPYYEDLVNKKCSKCSEECQTCSGPTPTECSNCVKGYFKNGTTCTQCHSYCTACFGPNSNTCSECASVFQFQADTQECVESCGDGYFLKDGDRNCYQCNSQCKTCQGPLNNECNSCATTTYYFYKFQCFAACPDYSMEMNDNGYLYCRACDPSCLECNGNANTDCIQCPVGKFLNNGLCISTCPNGKFKDNENSLCAVCMDVALSQFCLWCTSKDFCTRCDSALVNQYLIEVSNNPSQNTCQAACDNGYYINETDPNNLLCVQDCPIKQYKNTSNQKCSICQAPCENCKALDDCETCASGFYLYNNYNTSQRECLATCPDGTFDSGSECLPCLPSDQCQSCNSETCLTCDDTQDLYLKQLNLTPSSIKGICISRQPVPDGYYFDENDIIFQKCDPNCLTCTGPTSKHCIICQPSFFLFGYECLNTCPVTYYGDINLRKCISCTQYCGKCSSDKNCISCSQNYYLSQDQKCQLGCPYIPFLFQNLGDMKCYKSCPQKTYLKDATNKICENCSAECVECFGPDTKNCKSCVPTKFELKVSDLDFRCVQNCQLVNDIQYYQDETVKPQRCVINCPENFFRQKGINNTYVCGACHSNCSSCFGQAFNQCSKCKAEYFFVESEKTCVDQATCELRQSFPDTQERLCSQCNAQCYRCTDQFDYTCKECKPGFVLDNTVCIDFILEVSKSCTDEKSLIDYDLKRCVASCRLGFFPTVDSNGRKVCEFCGIGCQQCTALKNCEICNDGFYIYNNQCFDNCSTKDINLLNHPADATKNLSRMCTTTCRDGYYKQDSQCQLCKKECLTCKTYEICLSCVSGTFLSQTFCQYTCNSGFYKNIGEKQCLPCNKPCQRCTDSPDICSQCEQDPDPELQKFLFEGRCETSCPQGYVKNSSNKICEECNQTCSSCINQPEFCTSCPEKNLFGFVYYFNSEQKSCKTDCEDGFYENLEQKLCKRCDDSCLTCIGAGPDSCNQCPTNKVKHGNTCIDTCPEKFFKNASSVCQICHGTCQKCTGADQNKCSVCVSPLIFKTDDNICIDEAQCPVANKYFIQKIENEMPVCQQCHENCNQCDQPGYGKCIGCNSIQSDLYKVNWPELDQKYWHCGLDCPQGYGSNTGQFTCSICAESTVCQKCLGEHPEYCKLCFPENYLYKGICRQKVKLDCPNLKGDRKNWLCVEVCPQYTYESEEICWPCHFSCEQCQSTSGAATDCSVCLSTYPIIHENLCLNKCPLGFYQATSTSCSQCIDGCDKCDANHETCEVCNSNFVMYTDQTCVQQCPIGYRVDESTGVQQCVQCQGELCQKCTQNESECELCIETAEFEPENPLQICREIVCKPGTILQNRSCVPCADKNCAECQSSSQVCDICQDTFKLNDSKTCNSIIDVPSSTSPSQTSTSTISSTEPPISASSSEPGPISSSTVEPSGLPPKPTVCSDLIKFCIECDIKNDICLKCQDGYRPLSAQQVCIKNPCDSNCAICDSKVNKICIQCQQNQFWELINDTCKCISGYSLDYDGFCQKTNTPATIAAKTGNSATSAIAIAAVAAGGTTVSSMRAIEITQMLSYIMYADVQYQGGNQACLETLNTDNLSTMMPNALKGAFSESNSTSSSKMDQTKDQNAINSASSTTSPTPKGQLLRRFLETVDAEQASNQRFMKNGKTANFIYNFSPLVFLYLIVGGILLIKHLIFKYSSAANSANRLVIAIQLNINQNLFLLTFYLTLQEQLMIVLLQFSNVSFANATYAISFFLACLAFIHIVFMIGVIFRAIFQYSYMDNYALKDQFGPIFGGLKRESHLATKLIIIKLIQKFLVVMLTLSTSDVKSTLLILGSISLVVLLYEIIVRPYQSKLVLFLSIILNLIYVSCLFLVIMLFDAEKSGNAQDIDSSNQNLEKALITFLIIQNFLVFIDLLFCLAFIRNMFKKIMMKEPQQNYFIEQVTQNDQGTVQASFQNIAQVAVNWNANPIFIKEVEQQAQKAEVIAKTVIDDAQQNQGDNQVKELEMTIYQDTNDNSRISWEN